MEDGLARFGGQVPTMQQVHLLIPIDKKTRTTRRNHTCSNNPFAPAHGLEKRAGELDKHHICLTVVMITCGFLINQQGFGNLHSSFAKASLLNAQTVRAGAAELETPRSVFGTCHS